MGWVPQNFLRIAVSLAILLPTLLVPKIHSEDFAQIGLTNDPWRKSFQKQFHEMVQRTPTTTIQLTAKNKGDAKTEAWQDVKRETD